MKTPTWATAVAICMIVLGGCSILNDIQSIKLPDAIETAKVEAEKKLKDAQVDSSTQVSADSLTTSENKQTEKSIKEKQKQVEEILSIPEFSKTWIVRFGYIGLAAAALYIAGGIFLMLRKSFSIKLAYAALGISILTSGLQAAVLTSSSSSGMIALWAGLSQVLGIVIDVILLAVIFSSDKEAYQTQH